MLLTVFVSMNDFSSEMHRLVCVCVRVRACVVGQVV